MTLKRHKDAIDVKAYLLGALDERESVALEQKYFREAAFFEWVWKIEADLIADYLQDRLTLEERNSFRRRYLEVPELTRRVNEIKAQLPGYRRSTIRLRWQVVLGAAVLAVSLAIPFAITREGRSHGQKTSAAVVQNLAPPAVFQLTPGMVKGNSAQQVEIPLSAGRRLRLRFELPGRSKPIPCVVAFKTIGDGGPGALVWRSGTLRSEVIRNEATVEVDVDAAKLRPGDYIGEVQTPLGTVMETYSFRLVNPQ